MIALCNRTNSFLPVINGHFLETQKLKKIIENPNAPSPWCLVFGGVWLGVSVKAGNAVGIIMTESSLELEPS